MLQKCFFVGSALATVASAATQKQGKNNDERPPTAQLRELSYNDVYEMKPYDDGNGILVGGPSKVR
jgi:hypothetical protein